MILCSHLILSCLLFLLSIQIQRVTPAQWMPLEQTTCSPCYEGPTCQKHNVALGKTATSSSIHNMWTADKAVDGDKRQKVDDNTCFHSGTSDLSPWWTVDLGGVFPMNNIVIYYRNEGDGILRRFLNARMLVANTTGGEVLCTTITQQDVDAAKQNNAVFRFNCSSFGSKLFLRHGGVCNHGCILEPCEVQVFVCTEGHYGQDCSGQCGNCSDGANCHHVTGFCPGGLCQPGYRGDRCDQNCPLGTYGQNCSGQCGHCSDGPSCHHETGSCLSGSCQAGYNGSKCDEICTQGSYGQDCGDRCGQCEGEVSCHHVNGSCLGGGCLPGYREDGCDQECSNGTYGQECTYNCGNCSDGAFCHHVTGSCLSGSCQPGYRGDRCDEVVREEVVGGSGGPSEAVIGGVVAAVVVGLAAVIVVLVLFLRRNGKGETTCLPKRGTSSPGNEDVNVFANAAVQEESTSSRQNRRDHAGEVVTFSGATAVYANMAGLPGVAEVSSPSCVSTAKLEDFVAAKKAKGTLAKEYKEVPDSFLAPHEVSQQKEHLNKNKFRGYYPYDFNRVVLEPTAADPNSHYINASFIDGYQRKSMFIAAQAPTPVTLPDFLRMIWQQKCSHVVMLTNLVEEMKVKSVRYWPEAEGENLKNGEITVTLTQKTEWSYCTLRLLTLTHESGSFLTVKQFHFTTWPDHGVPSHVDMLDFFWKVRASWTSASGPLLVHCSAGVGRTGTFIALFILSDQAASQHRVDPLATLTSLRHQRRNMIQTQVQYEFLHEALVRLVQLGRTAVDKEDFCSQFPSKRGGLVVGHRTLNQLAQNIPKICDVQKQVPSVPVKSINDAHVYTNSTKWDYFENSLHFPSTATTRGFEVVRMWDSGTEEPAPAGLWEFLHQIQACAVVDLHCKKSLVRESSQEEGSCVEVEWRQSCSLEAGLTSRHLSLKSKGILDVNVESIAVDVATAKLPGCLARVASRLASAQLSTSCPVALLYRPSEEGCAQLLCAAVNLAQSLRLDGHMELVNSLLRLHTSLDSSLVLKLAEVAHNMLLDDASIYSND